MSDFPAHASPALNAVKSPRPEHGRTISDYNLTHEHAADDDGDDESRPVPPILSPSFTPPATLSQSDLPPTSDPTESSLTSAAQQHDQAEQPTPKLLQVLPTVTCEVRARIPTTTGQEMFLHLYSNSADNKEHLAIVFGPHIRSRSLDAPRPDETEKDRMIRGAYTGTLYPGRTSSRIDQIRREAGVGGSPMSRSGSALGHSGSSSTSETHTDNETNSSEDLYPEEIYGQSPPDHLAAPLVRIHSECYTGETVWSARCDCGEQLDEAARLMSLPSTPATDTPTSGGVIVYLRQEGRGIGLLSKLKAYNLQDLGHDTMQANLELRHPADARSYGLATAMLLDLGLGGERGIRLLTNNPEKVRAVEGPNREVRVAERVAMVPLAWKSGGKEGVRGPEVEKYISTKIEKFKHMFSS